MRVISDAVRERIWQVNSVRELGDLPARAHEVAFVSLCAGDFVSGWYHLDAGGNWRIGAGVLA